ncbi:MAG: DUF551 domain-containing protein [Roseburia sp.]|nr:DUF551 domain-containing protein [Roseburia sp.]
MQEIFEKIIEKLEERTSFLSDCTKYGNKDAKQQNKSYSTMMMYEVADLVDDLIEIVNQAAAEYNNTIIDGKYCFQTCACTEKCDKCSRLCNGDIDWYENMDNWAEEYNNGWIPCSERLPETNESVLCWAKSTARGGDVCFVGSCHNSFWFLQSSADTHSFPGQYVVIAWQPIEPYQPKGE